jgi:hypothetical protein
MSAVVGSEFWFITCPMAKSDTEAINKSLQTGTYSSTVLYLYTTF